MKRKLLFAVLMIAGALGLSVSAQTWTDATLDGGRYVFQNVGSGRFLGPSNSWGTQASLIEASHWNQLHSLGNGAYNIESQVSNGGTNYYLTADLFMDGAPATITIQTNGTYFSMAIGTDYLGYGGSNTVLTKGSDREAANFQWQIVPYDDYLTGATGTNPKDATYRIYDANFDRNNRFGGGDNNDKGNQWTMVASNQNLCGGTNENKCAESWRAAFTLSQTINLPNGIYKVRAQAALTEYTVTGANFPVVYATGTSTVTTPFKTMQHGENSMNTMSGQFTSGLYYTDWSSQVNVTDGKLIVGVKGTRTDTWCIWDNIQLQYLGAEIDLSALAADLATAVANAQAVEGTVPTVIYNQIAAVVSANNGTYSTAAEYTTAITAINNAVSTYATADIVAAYSKYLKVRTATVALDDDASVFSGSATVDVSDADAAANAATTVADIDAAIPLLRNDANTFLGAVTVNSGKFFTITDIFLENADFSAGDITGWETNFGEGGRANNFGYQGANYTNGAVSISKFIEAWKNGATLGDGYLRQTVSGLPEGKYTLEADAIAVWQSAPETETTGAYLYINAGGVDFKTAMNTGNALPEHFTTEFLSTGGVDVTFGLKTESTNANWVCADNFVVKFYGIDLGPYATLLAQAVAEAQAVNGTVPAGVYSELESVVTTYNKTYSTSSEYTTAIAAIQAATATAKAAVVPYNRYQQIRAAVLAIDSYIDVSTADADLNDATNAAEVEAAISTLREALTDYMAMAPASIMPIDVTAALVDNASPGTAGNDDFWTATAALGRGNNLIEYYQKSGATYTQRLGVNMPAGIYNLTVVGYTRTGYDAVITANTFTAPMAQVASSSVNNRAAGNTWIAAGNGVATLTFQLTAAQALTIGLTAATTGDQWTAWRSFKLEYLGSEFPPYTLATGKMNATVAAAQTAAEAAFLADKTMDNYNALNAAIAQAEASVAAYAVAAAELAKARAIRENHNLATAEATTTFDGVISTWTTAYDEGTMADADANSLGATLGTVVTGHRGGANGAAVKYIESGFGLNAFDEALYINTWSVEGETDGSGFKVPFFEYWIGDTETLADHVWTGTVSGLENGLYKVSASVRVRATNGVTPTDATGITLSVNDGTAVDVTEGTQVGESQFNLGAYEAEGLVKDGTLHVNFAVAGANISWLSFQNVKYTKVRDLTPEEAAIVPTAIALDQTSVTLTAAANTVTLTPSFTPTDATPTVTWTTSDAAVATVVDGVVTGVAPGTATITVTSNFDATVQATCEVTVSYPETVVPTSDVVLDGPTKTTVTYGTENLIKNGAFEYPDAFFAWTSANNFSDKLTSAKFTTQTEGGNTYLVGTVNEGSNASGSIGTAWPIEAGKTYAFSYRVKSLGTAAGEQGYLVTSLTNTKGDETSVLGKPTLTAGEWTTFTKVFTNTDNYQYLQVKFRWLSNNFGFDDFYLVEVVDETIVGNVAYITDNVPTSNIGTNAFQYSQDNINAATSLVQDVATVDEVKAAYKKMMTLNAPDVNERYNIKVATAGHAKEGNAILAGLGATSANNPTGYTFQVNNAPTAYMAQAFGFESTGDAENTNDYYIFVERAEGKVYLTNGTLNGSAAGWKASQIQGTTVEANKRAFTIAATATDNVFNIVNTETNSTVAAQVGGNIYTEAGNADFTVAVAPKATVNVNVSAAAGYGTIIVPFNADIPAGMKAYTCVDTDNTKLVLEESTTLKANVPYILEGAGTATLSGYGMATETSYTESLLTGVYEPYTTKDGDYVLQKHGDVVAFFEVNTADAQPTVGANRCYLTDASGSGVKAFYFNTADGIQRVEVDADSDIIYNLAGQRVSKAQKGGIYVINGKKVLVK